MERAERYWEMARGELGWELALGLGSAPAPESELTLRTRRLAPFATLPFKSPAPGPDPFASRLLDRPGRGGL